MIGFTLGVTPQNAHKTDAEPFATLGGPFTCTVTASAQTADLHISTARTIGTFYWYVSATDVEPDVDDLMSGNFAFSFGSLELASQSTVSQGPIGLSSQTQYFLFALLDDDGPLDIMRKTFATTSSDTVAPALSNAVAFVVDMTTISGSVTSTEANGLLSFIATHSNTPATAEQIEAGQDSDGSSAAALGVQIVTTPGPQEILTTLSGLKTGQSYYLQFCHRDAAGNVSATSLSSSVTPVDTIAPVVSSVEATAETPVTCVCHFNTDRPDGTAYWVVQPATDAKPSKAQMMSGLHGVARGSIAITSYGKQQFDASDLEHETEYSLYVIHASSNGVNSDVTASSASFTTPSATLIAQYFSTGQTSQAVVNNALVTGNFLDSTGGNNAILLENDGLGSGQILLRTPGNGIVYNNGINVLRARLRTIQAPGKCWIRLLCADIGSSGRINIDITDDETPDFTRIGGYDNLFWSMITVEKEATGWINLEATINLSGPDFLGRIQLNLAMASGGSQVTNDASGAYQIAVHNLTISKE